MLVLESYIGAVKRALSRRQVSEPYAVSSCLVDTDMYVCVYVCVYIYIHKHIYIYIMETYQLSH